MGSSDSVQQRTFSLLRGQIIDMELPPGTAMSVYELSEKLNVSRTPVREAFIRLSSESLVSILPQRSTLVSKIDFSRVRQERFLRVALELAAIPEFLKNLRPATLEAMRAVLKSQRDAVKNGDAVGMLRHDDAFHAAVFEVAGQVLSWGIIEKMSGHYRRVRLMMVRDGEEAEEVIGEHEAMIDAFSAGDGALAIARTEAHLRKIILQENRLRNRYPDFFEA
ncbi:MAG: GntR family transcriptional regulator [Clostridiales bacterium]|nr:GntR family transcriptional regulator [Clostridiales bacterium]